MEEEKKALTLNGVMNTMVAVDGAKQMKKSYNDVNNKYDNLMGTNVSKGGMLGSGNKLIAQRTASEDLDFIYKEAGIKQSAVNAGKIVFNGAKKHMNSAAKAFNKMDRNNTRHINLAIGNLKKGNTKKGLKYGAKAIATTAPALATAGLIGVGTTKGLDKLNEKYDKGNHNGDAKLQKRLENKAIGATLTAALVGNAIANKSAYKPAKKVVETLKTEIAKYPGKRIKKHVPGAGVLFDSAQKANHKFSNRDKLISGHARKIFDRYEKQGKVKDLAKLKSDYLHSLKKEFRKNHASNSMSDVEIEKLWNKAMKENDSLIDTAIERIHNRNKKASDEIDYMIEKLAGRKMDYAKKVFKENF